MKKTLFSLLSATALLWSTSCSEEAIAPSVGEEAAVQFNVQLSDGSSASRAISDGTTVNKLYYEVYATTGENGDINSAQLTAYDAVVGLDVNAEGKKYAKLPTMNLVKGQTYYVVFWAQWENDNDNKKAYDATNLKNITVWDNATKANDETKDAFTAVEKITVTGAKSYNVELHRPFAQVNFLTTSDDVENAGEAGLNFDVASEKVQGPRLASTMSVSYAATQFNALTSEAIDAENAGVAFGWAQIPSFNEGLNISNVDYEYLATAYVLVPGNQATAEIAMEIETGLNETISLTVPNAPIQRNYRTNVLGNLLTNQTDFTVVVNPIYNKSDNNVIDGVAGMALESLVAQYEADGVEEATIIINEGSFATWTTGAGVGSTPFASADSKLKKLTIKGAGAGATFKALGAGVGPVGLTANDGLVVFENLTIVDESASYAENSWEYGYLEFGGNVEFNNCTIHNSVMLEGTSAKFVDCEFKGKSSIGNDENEYSAWVNNGTAEFNDCTFGPGYRGLKMHEDYGSEIEKVVVDDCLFTTLAKKPGIAIGDLNADTEVVITNNQFVDCQAGDQNLYTYETDTDVATITFTYENNYVRNGGAGYLSNGNYAAYTVEGLQEVINDAYNNATGEVTITLMNDITGNVTVVQKPALALVINGKSNDNKSVENKKYNGQIKVHSNSNYYDDAALTIKNVNFETSAASVNVIEALENGSERYSSNITVENCTFTATGEAVNTSVAVQVKATRGVTVTDCTATNMHSLIQAQSCDTGNVKVIKCTVDGKNGVAFKQVKAATVEGTTITALEYGIRFDGNIDNYGIVVKNNNVTAVQPFIVRKMTGKNNTIALEGTNTLTTVADYQIVITNGSDDAEYVKPTGTYTLTGADAYSVFPVLPKANFSDNSWENIISACQNNEVPATWNVGDKKAMTIGGKEYNIAIIGKNHDGYTDGGKAPLTFQLSEVYGTTAPMNETQTNTTGWSGSRMRNTTMVEILAVMPVEVRNAIKAVNKLTLNGTRDNLETTSDKLFLLSEIEVNGSVYFSNNFAEGSRYAYYTDLNSQIMNSSWWLRGPGKSNAIGFTQINMSGYMANGSAEYACGVVFGFCF